MVNDSLGGLWTLIENVIVMALCIVLLRLMVTLIAVVNLEARN